MNGAESIAAERQRQIEKEGWTPQHDDAHRHGEMGIAAVCYARQAVEQLDGLNRRGIPYDWPWEPAWWKPAANPVRNLEKAGALIAAEIDRLQRKAMSEQETLSNDGRVSLP